MQNIGPCLRQRQLPRRAISADFQSAELAALSGIESCEVSDEAVKLTYDLRAIQLAEIAEILAFDARGLSFFERIRWALIRFRESIHADDLNAAGGWDTIVRSIYGALYRPGEHAGQRRADEVADTGDSAGDSAIEAQENDDG